MSEIDSHSFTDVPLFCTSPGSSACSAKQHTWYHCGTTASSDYGGLQGDSISEVIAFNDSEAPTRPWSPSPLQLYEAQKEGSSSEPSAQSLRPSQTTEAGWQLERGSLRQTKPPDERHWERRECGIKSKKSGISDYGKLHKVRGGGRTPRMFLSRGFLGDSNNL